MLRTNNRCVESLNISVMSPNVENIQNSPSTLTICLLQKKVVMTKQSIHGKLSTHKDVLLCEE